ncbi:MAG: nicotinate-nucleotide adenylyltransferase, partial [Planctomycetaceae bacterium]
MKLGLLGGTFDPIHLGHLILAENCLEACQLDALWFLPTGIPPHKDVSQLTPGRDRVEMLQLATAGHPHFSVHTLELDREGVAYTVDTLEEIHRDHPQAELLFLIGADSLSDLPNWRMPQRIAELAQLVAVNRGSGQRPPIPEKLDGCVAARIQHVTVAGI